MNIQDLPHGDAPKALKTPHFPTRQQAVVWRNWTLVSVEKIATTIQTTPTSIRKLASDMGLIEDVQNYENWNKRGYMTIIRRNWHLLPYKQILELLDWTPEKLAFVLKEDDSLWIKLGCLKPSISPLKYKPLSDTEKLQTKNIFSKLYTHFPEETSQCEQPFEFIQNFGKKLNTQTDKSLKSDFNMKMLYSYSALYGDPLLDETLDPYPDNLLAQYAATGINAVWMQGILYTLVPWFGESTYSANWQQRLINLRKLCKRMIKYGIKFYIYLNEPRGMPEDFFRLHPEWKGSVSTEKNAAFCTSNPEILEALRDGVSMLFKEVPELGGIFCITTSENLTYCKSRTNLISECPKCANRHPAEFPVEIINAIAEGAHSVNPTANVIAWAWGWEKQWALRVIEQLPENVKLMCVSERDVPTNAMGIKGTVLDYSISKPGPSAIALKLWKKATERGLQTVAKVQINNTWECSALPYIPVPDLIERHLNSIKNAGVSDLMISWTLGGYPGGNIELLHKSKEDIALDKFGAEAAPMIITAWKHFSAAFENFPLHNIHQLYYGPQNVGPRVLLFDKPSNYKSTMVGFPYDDLKSWRGNHYPEDVFEESFKKMSEGWAKGLELLLSAKASIPSILYDNFIDLFNVSEAAYCHFRSSYLQIKFIRLRTTSEKYMIIKILDEEIELAKRLLKIIKCDSRIGFEASNHYYYTKNDLMEKILNCENLKTIFKLK
jgi:hypothetical protein